MKIAFAIEHFDPRHGGAEQYTWGLARWLAERGHNITILTTRAEAADFPAEVVLLEVPPGSRARWPQRVAAALAAKLRERQFDLVHGANHIWPCDVMRPGGGVHVAFEHYNALSEPSPLRRAVKNFSLRWLPRQRALRENEAMQFADPKRHFIAVSQRVADDMVRCYPHCAGRVHVIHNGVDAGKFSPEATAPRRTAARAKLDLRDDEVALLFVSNNFKLKGLHDLITAHGLLGKSPSYRLLIAGRGKPESYKRLAALLGIADRVTYIERGTPMIDNYAAADVLVHPTYYDACANAPIEAAACGLPVLLSEMSGINEVMAGSAGVKVIPIPCPAESLAAAIREVSTPEFREAARTSNRALAQANGIEQNYAKVFAVYEAVTASRVRPSAPA